jgi:uncharacterized OB-fold protein
MGTTISEAGRPLPQPNPTTQPFFDGARREQLVLQRCPRDGFFFYPRNRCPTCLEDDWSWESTSGRGTVYAFTVDRLGHDPLLASTLSEADGTRRPFVIAVVELEEGPRMTAGIVGCEPSAVRVGLPVRASFEHVEAGDASVSLVQFSPSEGEPQERAAE